MYKNIICSIWNNDMKTTKIEKYYILDKHKLNSKEEIET